MLPFRRIRQFLLEICENRWNKVHHFQPAMMHQSKPWKHQGFLPPKKAKTVMSAGKGISCSTTVKKSCTLTRAEANYTAPISRDKKNALPLGQCSSAYIVHPQWYMAAIKKYGFKLVEHPPDSLNNTLWLLFLPDYAKCSLVAVILAHMMMLWMPWTTS